MLILADGPEFVAEDTPTTKLVLDESVNLFARQAHHLQSGHVLSKKRGRTEFFQYPERKRF